MKYILTVILMKEDGEQIRWDYHEFERKDQQSAFDEVTSFLGDKYGNIKENRERQEMERQKQAEKRQHARNEMELLRNFLGK